MSITPYQAKYLAFNLTRRFPPGSVEKLKVRAKRDAAITWCAQATTYSTGHGGKPWRYILIPHDDIADNMTIAGLAARHGA